MWLTIKNKNAWKSKQNEIKKKKNECRKGGAAVLWGMQEVK